MSEVVYERLHNFARTVYWIFQLVPNEEGRKFSARLSHVSLHGLGVNHKVAA